MARDIQPLNVEVFFDASDIIVSKTDLKGRITYANRTFCDIAGYTEQQLLGQPHSLIRHPDMPRAVFKLLWDTLGCGEEVFAYVKNMSRSGAFYWVFAHVTPSRDCSGRIVGYHSSRRVPSKQAVAALMPIYATLIGIEQSHRNAKEGLAASYAALNGKISSLGIGYDEFVLSLAA